jgi:hydroxymethylpyrimidine/phosphomethylpyrimidine kinase
VLIKGGHFLSEPEQCDRLTDRDSSETGSSGATDSVSRWRTSPIEGEHHETTATHGTGCTLSAAIAANLALGHSLLDAVTISKKFVNEAIRTAPKLGHGNSPINISYQNRKL